MRLEEPCFFSVFVCVCHRVAGSRGIGLLGFWLMRGKKGQAGGSGFRQLCQELDQVWRLELHELDLSVDVGQQNTCGIKSWLEDIKV